MSEADKNRKPGVAAEEKAEPVAPKAAASKAEKEDRKGPGRPAGAKNKPKGAAGPHSPKDRKSAGSKLHPAKGADHHLKAYREHMVEENKRRRALGLEPLPVAEVPEKGGGAAPRYDVATCEKLVEGTFGGMGTFMQVEARPSEKDVKAMAEALSECSRYWDILHPKYVALVTLVMSTASCTGPMVREWRDNRAGKIRPKEIEAPKAEKPAAPEAETPAGERGA